MKLVRSVQVFSPVPPRTEIKVYHQTWIQICQALVRTMAARGQLQTRDRGPLLQNRLFSIPSAPSLYKHSRLSNTTSPTPSRRTAATSTTHRPSFSQTSANTPSVLETRTSFQAINYPPPPQPPPLQPAERLASPSHETYPTTTGIQIPKTVFTLFLVV